MLWRNRDYYGTRLSRITYPKCTPHNIYAYRGFVIRRWGNYSLTESVDMFGRASMKVPTRRQGNHAGLDLSELRASASMKVLTRRRRNDGLGFFFGECTSPQ